MVPEDRMGYIARVRPARFLPAVLLMLLLAGFSLPADACPGCSRAVAEGDATPGADASRGYNASILMMMSAPFLLTGIAGLLLYRSWRKDHRASSDPGDSPSCGT
jgi:hypothetical protein